MTKTTKGREMSDEELEIKLTEIRRFSLGLGCELEEYSETFARAFRAENTDPINLLEIASVQIGGNSYLEKTIAIQLFQQLDEIVDTLVVLAMSFGFLKGMDAQLGDERDLVLALIKKGKDEEENDDDYGSTEEAVNRVKQNLS